MFYRICYAREEIEVLIGGQYVYSKNRLLVICFQSSYLLLSYMPFLGDEQISERAGVLRVEISRITIFGNRIMDPCFYVKEKKVDQASHTLVPRSPPFVIFLPFPRSKNRPGSKEALFLSLFHYGRESGRECPIQAWGVEKGETGRKVQKGEGSLNLAFLAERAKAKHREESNLWRKKHFKIWKKS